MKLVAQGLCHAPTAVVGGAAADPDDDLVGTLP